MYDKEKLIRYEKALKEIMEMSVLKEQLVDAQYIAAIALEEEGI